MLMLAVACAGLLAAGCGQDSSSGGSTAGDFEAAVAVTPRRKEPRLVPPKRPTPRHLVKRDLIPGTGAEARSGDRVTIDYTGVGYETGYFFESSWDRDEPYSFTLGREVVMPGWDLGIEGMKVGGRRELIIPARLAYGESGSGVVSPHDPLMFVIDLRAVRSPSAG